MLGAAAITAGMFLTSSPRFLAVLIRAGLILPSSAPNQQRT
jgi:hypothetical protein